MVRERRRELNISQEGLADETLDQSYISRLERGEREIGIRSLIILASKLKMTPGELMNEVMARMKVEATSKVESKKVIDPVLTTEATTNVLDRYKNKPFPDSKEAFLREIDEEYERLSGQQ